MSLLKLKEIRQSRHETQQQLAESIDVAINTIQKAEQGYRLPSDPIKIKIAEHYELPVGYIFFDDPITISNKKEAIK